MSDGYIVQNARIQSADIGFARGFALDCSLMLELDGCAQGFGGWVLGGNPFDTSAVCARHADQKNLAADFIGGVMAVAGVELFSDLPGKIIRIKKVDEFSKIAAIGHPVKDIWYFPADRLAALKGDAA